MGSLEDQLFRLKFASKQFERSAKKAEKEAKQAKLKVKTAIEQGNAEGARIYAENAIRKKNEYMNSLRLASRLDGVASRLQTAIRMNTVTRTMGSVVGTLNVAISGMDPAKISTVMETFEKQFEDLDVTSKYVESTMSESSSMTTPEGEVNSLLQEVGDEYGLKVSGMFGDASPSKERTKTEADDLSERLAKLKEKQ